MLFWNLLISEEVQSFVENALKRKMDALQVSTALQKFGYTNEERAAIMDYMALVPKFRSKFGCCEFLLCDRLALEQSTAKDIGTFKSQLWPAQGSVHDLCCGMGGDSFFLPKALHLTGVDLDENRLAMYRHNLKAFGKEVDTICGDVREFNLQSMSNPQKVADYFTIDPARRAAEGENQRDLRNLSPTFQEVVALSKRYKGGMAKLPPGYPLNEIPDGTEILFLGGHNDCRECLVLFGELAQNPDTLRVVMVDKNGQVMAQWSGPRDKSQETLDEELQEKLDKNDSLEGCDRTYRTATSKCDLPLGSVSKYLSEPAPLLIRSRLFKDAALAADETAHLISEGIAYVCSDKPLNAPGFACFEVLGQAEIATGAVRTLLKEHQIGNLTLKLRGVKLDPDAEIKRLKPKGKNSAVLFYTRVKGEKKAILTKRV